MNYKNAIIILLLILASGMAGTTIYLLWFKEIPKSDQIKKQPNTTNIKTAVEDKDIPGGDTEVVRDNVVTYTSQELGLSFKYLKTVEDQSFYTKRIGNKICVSYDLTDTNCSAGQYVEKFEKDSNLTLAQAITIDILSSKDKERCFVETLDPVNIGSNFVQAIISFPVETDFDLEKMMQKTDYCSKDYAKTNGIRYFLEDTNSPSKYFFFNIGQYGIPAGNNLMWQDTFEVLK